MIIFIFYDYEKNGVIMEIFCGDFLQILAFRVDFLQNGRFSKILNRHNQQNVKVKISGHLGDPVFDPVGNIFSKLLRNHLYRFILKYPSLKNTVFHGSTANTM